jgi:carbon-monoxide dehydrogenase small subunit
MRERKSSFKGFHKIQNVVGRWIILKQSIELKVNGEICKVDVKPRRTLLEVLRDDLGLTGAKNACDSGECGACSVIMDGKLVASCLVLAVEAQGKNITTIEGLGREGELDPLQKSFVEHGAIQCGFCTPGMILAGKVLLDKNPNPTAQEVRQAISGNLCRCTGYAKIVEAILKAASQKEDKRFEESARGHI